MQPVSFVAAVSLLLTLMAMPAYINWLKSKQIQQYIREEGPQSHASKGKTPTMGGLVFIATSVVVGAGYILIFGTDSSFTMPLSHLQAIGLAVLATGVMCAMVGFADDYAKLTSRSNRGLSARIRLIIEFAIGGILSAVLVLNGSRPEILGAGNVIVLHGAFKIFYFVCLIPFLIAATTNAINLHDGMDGLAAGTSTLVFAMLFLLLLATGSYCLAGVCASMVGALVGFLFFNKYPAKVFMGDTGSLYIGGLMAAVVAAGGLALWFIPLALLYIAETVSVIAQVCYFKVTKPYEPATPVSKPALIWMKLTKRLPGEGKRLLRMAPLHHHFEAIAAERGEPEWTTVSRFLFGQFLLCAATLICWVSLFLHK